MRRRGWWLLGCALLALIRPAAGQTLPLLGLPLPGGKTPSLSLAPGAQKGASAWVQFNNTPLFQVYSAENRAARDRADLASLRLSDALREASDSGAAPAVTVDTSGADTILRLGSKPLLTVTDDDTANTGQTAVQLASSWSSTINAAFAQALRERQPHYLRWAAKRAGLFVVVGILVTVLIWIISHDWLDRPGWPVLTLVWIVVIRNVLDLFPQTRPYDAALSAGVWRPLTIFLLVGLAAAVAARVWGGVLRRLVPTIPEDLSPEERTERTFRRRATLMTVTRVTGVTLIWIVALAVALSWSGVNLGALLTSAGLIGVALGLAAQDTMKDIVAGINILSDDRYGVGDTIRIGQWEGKVEKLDLRITQIRDTAGRLITIPNHNITDVANLTNRWAQVDFQVGVSYYDDLAKASEVMLAAARKLADEWPDRVLAAPEMLGPDAFNDSNITLRMVVRVVPGEQWAVARELRARVKAAFDEAGIAILNSLHPSAPVQVVAAPAADGPHTAADGPHTAAPATADRAAVSQNGDAGKKAPGP